MDNRSAVASRSRAVICVYNYFIRRNIYIYICVHALLSFDDVARDYIVRSRTPICPLALLRRSSYVPASFISNRLRPLFYLLRLIVSASLSLFLSIFVNHQVGAERLVLTFYRRETRRKPRSRLSFHPSNKCIND